MTFLNLIITHWGVDSAAILLLLKWVYNAWTPNVSFSQFVRQFIGEVVQEQPDNFKLQSIRADNKVGPNA